MCVRIIIHVLGICIDNHRYMRTYTLALVLPLPGRSSHDLFSHGLDGCASDSTLLKRTPSETNRM